MERRYTIQLAKAITRVILIKKLFKIPNNVKESPSAIKAAKSDITDIAINALKHEPKIFAKKRVERCTGGSVKSVSKPPLNLS